MREFHLKFLAFVAELVIVMENWRDTKAKTENFQEIFTAKFGHQISDKKKKITPSTRNTGIHKSRQLSKNKNNRTS